MFMFFGVNNFLLSACIVMSEAATIDSGKTIIKPMNGMSNNNINPIPFPMARPLCFFTNEILD